MKKQVSVRLEEEKIKMLKRYCIDNDTSIQELLEKLIDEELFKKMKVE